MALLGGIPFRAAFRLRAQRRRALIYGKFPVRRLPRSPADRSAPAFGEEENMDLRKIVWQQLDPEARERPGFSSANMGWRAKDASRMWRRARSTRSLLLWAFVIG